MPYSGYFGCGLPSDLVPWQQRVDAIGRVIGDAGQDVGEPGLRIDIVKLRGDDQAVQEGGAKAAAIGAGEQPGFSAESQSA